MTSDGTWLETLGAEGAAPDVVRLPGLDVLEQHGLRVEGLGTLMNPVGAGAKRLGWTLRDIRSRR